MTQTDQTAIRRARREAPTTFSSPGLHRLQRRHFLAFDVLPALGTLAAVGLIPVLPPDGVALGLFVLFWLATGLGLTVGYHRYFTHQAFSTRPVVALALLVCGSMAARGPMISWVAMHRRHHERADREGDLHSPNLLGAGRRARLRGFLYAHLTWMIRHDYPNVMHYAPDLMRDKVVLRCNRHYYGWVALGLVLPGLLGGLLTRSWSGALIGFLWGGVVRLFVVEHTMSAINSLGHLVGARPYETRGDQSRNNPWLGFLTWGEASHNNHHAFPNSAAFGHRWYELDPGYWLIVLLQVLGLAWDVRRPAEGWMAQRRLDAGET